MAPVHIVSPWFDRLWFLGPGVVSAAIGLGLGLFSPQPRPVSTGLWIICVVLIDVAHVWASLYRTYLDPVARQLHRRRLVLTPALVAWFGFLLHLESPTAFWTILAYLAVFHFVMQHLGFVRIAVRKGMESQFDRRLATAALVANTLGPVAWWHSHLPREFAWFVAGDFLTGVPRWVGTFALSCALVVALVFAARRLWLALRRDTGFLVLHLVLWPALNWWLGIVVFNDDRIFTITNVTLHGVTYMALVWVTGGAQQIRQRIPPVRGMGRPTIVALFYGVLLALAFAEEALWDRWVWHDQIELFGTGTDLLQRHPLALAAIVALLTVPQATHYLLDRHIWRIGPTNPDLAAQLGLSPGRRLPPKP